MQRREIFVAQIRIVRFEADSQDCNDAKQLIEQYIINHGVDLNAEPAVKSEWFVINVSSLNSNDGRVYRHAYQLPLFKTD